MNIARNKFFILNGFALILSFILSLFSHQERMLQFINSYFMIGLFYLAAGALLYVIGGGFFNIFAYTFKKFWKVNSKKEKYIAEMEGKPKHEGPDMEVIQYSWTLPLVLSGLFAFFITFGFSIVFYM